MVFYTYAFLLCFALPYVNSISFAVKASKCRFDAFALSGLLSFSAFNITHGPVRPPLPDTICQKYQKITSKRERKRKQIRTFKAAVWDQFGTENIQTDNNQQLNINHRQGCHMAIFKAKFKMDIFKAKFKMDILESGFL